MLNIRSTFEQWISDIDIRIFDWVESENNKIDFELDFKLESFNNFENYLVNNFTYESLITQSEYPILDACVSYIGETFRKNFSNSKWVIYEEKSNVYYNLPCIKTQYSPPLCPHKLLEEILTVKSGQILISKSEVITKIEKQIIEALKRNNK